jgi:hypothetical protein
MRPSHVLIRRVRRRRALPRKGRELAGEEDSLAFWLVIAIPGTIVGQNQIVSTLAGRSSVSEHAGP